MARHYEVRFWEFGEDNDVETWRIILPESATDPRYALQFLRYELEEERGIDWGDVQILSVVWEDDSDYP